MSAGVAWRSRKYVFVILPLVMIAVDRASAQEIPPLFYSAKEIRATVVDAATGEPLAGVVVVAQWVLFVAGLGHGGHGPRLHVTEVVTDAGGTLHIPSWGPKPNPRFPFTSLMDRDPRMSFFKAGYRPDTVQNEWNRNNAVRFSEWDGKTIKLAKFAGSDEDRVKELGFLQTDVGWGWTEAMDWRWMPRMVLAIELERQKVDRRGRILSPLSAFGTSVEEVRRFLAGRQ